MNYIKYFVITIVLTTVSIYILLSIDQKNNSFFSSQLKYSNNSTINNKLLCLILTSENTIISRAIPVYKYWANKCHKSLFAFNAENFTKFMNSNESKNYYKNEQDYQIALNLPIMHLNLNETHEDMGRKIFYVIQQVFEKYHDEFNWFLVTDDDTYIFVDHLYKFISKKSSTASLIYGYNFKVEFPTGYLSGGAG
jgi:hypothetical protein